MQMQQIALLLLAGLVMTSAQPFQPGQNLAPLGKSVQLQLERIGVRRPAAEPSMPSAFKIHYFTSSRSSAVS